MYCSLSDTVGLCFLCILFLSAFLNLSNFPRSLVVFSIILLPLFGNAVVH